MQGSKKEPDISIAKLRSNSDLSCQSWWSSIESHCPESALSQDSSLKMGVPAQRYQGMNLLDFSRQDQDSCSTQSTGQSYSRVAGFGEIDLKNQTLSFTQPDNNVTHDTPEASEDKFTSSLGPQNCILPPLQAAGYNQSFPQLAVNFPDQHFSSMMSPYGPQALVMGVMPGRVPLPLDLSTNEPIYVNAKQYRGILRRRERRAKLEAQNKLVKNRKPYLHESRHQHALKRARGSGGRFLNSKQLEESRSASATAAGRNNSGSISLHQGGKNLEAGFRQQERYREGASTPTGSDVTSTSTSDDIYHPSEFRFYDYSSRIGESMQGGGENSLKKPAQPFSSWLLD